MNTLRLLPLVALVAIAAPLYAQASLAGPRLFPRGARAPGFQETVFDAAAIAYTFTLKSETGAILVQYQLPLRHANMMRGVLRVEELTTGVVPIAGGGLMYRDQMPGPAVVGRLFPAYELAFGPITDPLHTATVLSHSLNTTTGVVSITFRDDYQVGGGPVPSEKTYELRLCGKSLEIHATSNFAVRSSAQYNHAGFAFGPGDGLKQPGLAFHVPYMDSVPVFVGADGTFVSRIVDWYRSSASFGVSTDPNVTGSVFNGECAPAQYRNDFNELNAPIDETVYVTVSSEVADVLAVVDRPPSEYRMHLADRAVSQAGPGQLYTSDTAWLLRARGLGLADMAHIKWDWSKWPLNLNDPDFVPAAPGVACGTTWGTQSDWLAYASAAARSNWTLAPYFEESGNDYGYPNLTLLLPGSVAGSVLLTPNPVYVAAASVRDANNVPKQGWDTNLNLKGTNLQGQGHPQEIVGAHLRAANMSGPAAAIHGVGGYTPFKVAGAHTDAATGICDWIEIDQRKFSGFPKTVAENMKWREQSFRALKDGMDGPLFGENSHWRYKAFESYDAGLLDGTSRKIPIHWSPSPTQPPDAENQHYLVVPDFELSEVITKATGFFGMGWEASFASPLPDNPPPPPQWGFSDAFVDAWDATLLSYGHAPYFSTNGDVSWNFWDWQRNLRSYYLCYGVSKAMRSSTVTQVRYVDSGGVEHTLAQALPLVITGQMDLTAPRLVLRFGNGLEFKANHSATTWVTSVLGVNWTIPGNGFVAAMPGGLLAFSAINPTSSQRCDYAFNPGHSEVIDRRGRNQSFNGFPGGLLPVPGSLPQFNNVDDRFMCVVRDARENRAIYGSGLLEGSIALGAAPTAAALTVAIDDTDTMSGGRPYLGVRAVLADSLGNQRDVTGLCTWTSGNPSIVTVNRFGGLKMAGAGTATITAFLPGANLTAARAINATLAPVLSGTGVIAVTSSKALLNLTTDSACTVTILLRNLSTGVVSTVTSRPDPAQKQHQFALRSLTSLTSYQVTPTAVNSSGLATTGGTITFTTL